VRKTIDYHEGPSQALATGGRELTARSEPIAWLFKRPGDDIDQMYRFQVAVGDVAMSP
jgi:hypothetical protein